MICVALTNIIACFHFPRIFADVVGAFDYVDKKKYFLSTSQVFGSNTSASSLEEPFRQAIQNLISILAQQTIFVEKHKDLIDMLRWVEEDCNSPELVQAFLCEMNTGVVDSNGNLLPIMTNIYVNDILEAAASQ
jgi:hypothetical protein